LSGYKPVFANFIIKDPIPASAVVPHLDWPVVDESRFSALRFWVPLQDVNEINSTIGLFPGSHRKIKLIRGTPRYSFPYQDYAHELYDLAIYPEMNAGDALFFFNELLHCSKANQSNSVRLAFDYQLAPVDARLYHYYFPPHTHEVLTESAILEIEQWEVSPEFYVTFHIQKPLSGPHCRKVADIRYHWRKVSKEELGI
jgi:ectoine hydroxylase-related dioxygenase (phytanoyl-CoA dioxygenase family)